MSNGIRYTPDLIEDLERDHQALLRSYGRLVKTANKTDFSTFKAELAVFKSLLVAHLLKEAIRLYIYLRQQFKADAAMHGLVTSYKVEMDGIGRVAMGFIDTHLNASAGTVDFSTLTAQLSALGKVLGDRIRREEAELYPLYNASY